VGAYKRGTLRFDNVVIGPSFHSKFSDFKGGVVARTEPKKHQAEFQDPFETKKTTLPNWAHSKTERERLGRQASNSNHTMSNNIIHTHIKQLQTGRTTHRVQML